MIYLKNLIMMKLYNLIDVLNENKNTINLNLDYFTSIILFLNELKVL